MKSNPNRYALQLVIKQKLTFPSSHKRIQSNIVTSNKFHQKISKYIDDETQQTQQTINKNKNYKDNNLSISPSKNIKISANLKDFLFYISGKSVNKNKQNKKQNQESWKSYSQIFFVQKSFLQADKLQIQGKNIQQNKLHRRIKSSIIPKIGQQTQKFTKKRTLSSLAKTTGTLSNKIIKKQNDKSIQKKLIKNVRMIFNQADYEAEYRKKIKDYLQFLFKVNYTNRVDICLNLHELDIPIKKYKIYIEKGRSNLTIQLLKRRFWYEIVTQYQPQCYLYWTWNNSSIYQYQKPTKQNKQNNKFKQYIQQPSHHIFSMKQNEQIDKNIKKNGMNISKQTIFTRLISNHIYGTKSLTNKANFIKNIRHYYEDILDQNPFTFYPKSYLIKSLRSPQMDFFKYLLTQQPQKIWLIYPSGMQRQLLQADTISKYMTQLQKDEGVNNFLVQQYIREPFLYNNRKWDIRHFGVLSIINQQVKFYWYKDGYIRTSSKQYQFKSKIKCRNPLAKKYKAQMSAQMGTWLKDHSIHFTGDSIQSQQDHYGKFQQKNKLSYTDIQKYFERVIPGYNFRQKIVPQMKRIACESIKSVSNLIDPQRKSANFQILSFDYLLDEDMKVWLTNIKNSPFPISNSPVIDRVVPSLIEDCIKLFIQPLLPPKNHFPPIFRNRIPTNPLQSLKLDLALQF